jgi:hypothetical protein
MITLNARHHQTFQQQNVHLQTLKDILEQKRPPEKLLERADVTLCEGVPEPEIVDRVPAKLPLLMIIGVLSAAVLPMHMHMHALCDPEAQ